MVAFSPSSRSILDLEGYEKPDIDTPPGPVWRLLTNGAAQMRSATRKKNVRQTLDQAGAIHPTGKDHQGGGLVGELPITVNTATAVV
jgi:hypothetical protein